MRADGARLALIVPFGDEPSADERATVALTVEGPAAPSPFGLFAALQAAALADVRGLGEAAMTMTRFRVRALGALTVEALDEGFVPALERALSRQPAAVLA